MAVIVPEGENSPLYRFLKHNLPECFFRQRPVFCFSAEQVDGLPADTVYLADSAFSNNSAGHLITCGRSSKDTFTFSSRGEDRASVALMRTVSTPFGTAEPMELPVEFPAGADDLAVLGATAIWMLSGITPEKVLNFTLPDMDSPPNTDGQNLNK